MSEATNSVLVERQRIQNEYRRREKDIGPDLYAPWNPSAAFMREAAKRTALQLLHGGRVFPNANSKCLEIGFGPMGWLADLLAWGVPEANIYGIELDAPRVRDVKRILPMANLLVGDATSLPWPEETFDLVITSTVFTSILDQRVREMLAQEVTRALRPGGALLWYDFFQNNPRNPNVKRVSRKEIEELFPRLYGKIKSVTLAPPLARRIVPLSWTLATILECVPFLRTHLLGVLIKES